MPLSRWLLILTTQRLAAILLLRPGGFFYDFTDYYTYRLYAQLWAEGFWPYRDFWLEYPPLFPIFNQLLYIASLQFPPLPDVRFWHHLLLALSLLPFDLGVAILFYRLMGRLWGQARAEWGIAVWVLLFTPLFVWQGFFDVLPLFGLLLVAWGMSERRPIWAGVGLAFGFLTKLLSVLALPAALWVFASRDASRWRGLFSRENGRMVGSFALLVIVAIAPLLWIGAEWLWAMVRNFGGRGAWQTVWALADGFYGYGQVFGDRFDPSPEFAVAPSRVPWIAVHLLFAALGFGLWCRRWLWHEPKTHVTFVGLTIFLFFLWSKGWSPQFTFMLLPWILLLLPNRWGVGISITLSFLMAAETIYFGFVVHNSTEASWMLVTIILLRTLILVMLCLVAIISLRRFSIIRD